MPATSSEPPTIMAPVTPLQQSRPLFPDRLRVFLLEYNSLDRQTIMNMLKFCRYQVTSCDRGMVALEILRKKKGEFDIVLTNLHMPDMNGREFLDHVVLEMDLPAVVMLEDYYHTRDDIVQSFTHGACDVIFKPLRMDILSVIWLNVVRKQVKDFENFPRSTQQIDLKRKRNAGGTSSSLLTSSRSLKNPEASMYCEYSPAVMKKPRVVWSSSNLHERFVAAVNQLGVENATAKKILDLMNVPGLKREHVSSHLQKYLGKLGRANKKEDNSGAHQHSESRREANTGMTQVAATTTDSIEMVDNTTTSMKRKEQLLAPMELFEKNWDEADNIIRPCTDGEVPGKALWMTDERDSSAWTDQCWPMPQVAATTTGSVEMVNNAAASLKGKELLSEPAVQLLERDQNSWNEANVTGREVTENAPRITTEFDNFFSLEQSWPYFDIAYGDD